MLSSLQLLFNRSSSLLFLLRNIQISCLLSSSNFSQFFSSDLRSCDVTTTRREAWKGESFFNRSLTGSFSARSFFDGDSKFSRFFSGGFPNRFRRGLDGASVRRKSRKGDNIDGEWWCKCDVIEGSCWWSRSERRSTSFEDLQIPSNKLLVEQLRLSGKICSFESVARLSNDLCFVSFWRRWWGRWSCIKFSEAPEKKNFISFGFGLLNSTICISRDDVTSGGQKWLLDSFFRRFSAAYAWISSERKLKRLPSIGSCKSRNRCCDVIKRLL